MKIQEESSNGKNGKRLSRVIGQGFALILLLTLITSVVSLVGLTNTANEYRGLLDTGVMLDEYSMDVSIHLLDAQRAEKNFILSGDSKYITEHDLKGERILELADKIIALDISDTVNAIAVDIKADYLIYDDNADHVFTLFIARGGGVFGSENGTVGDLYETVYEIDEMLLTDKTTLGDATYYQLKSIYLDIRKGEKDYLLRRHSGDDYTKYITDIDAQVIQFLVLTDASSLTQAIKTEFTGDWANYDTQFAELVALDDEIELDTATSLAASYDIEEKAEELEAEARRLVESGRKSVEDNVNNILITSIVLVVVAFAIGIALTIWVTRDIVKPIYVLEQEVSTISNGDLTSSLNFEKNPAAEISSLGTNVNQMKSSLQTIIGTISEASDVLNATSEDLLSGAEEINASAEEVASTSQAMSNGATSQTELISEVNEDIRTITDIVAEVVHKIQANTEEVSQISLQTNILALNAGIEASRAGDYGRGFAVVAENVRKLSDQSKDAADQIALVANEIVDKVQNSFSRISTSMLNIVSVSEETAASAEEVAAAAEEMTATIEELTSAAQELTTQAETSQDTISIFKIN
ncbi:MAG: methyl-accepting chemotaxis protein [Candidatus Kariarchaeaceae archaeon]|jgi:methyl-accepting chemotaxis protein